MRLSRERKREILIENYIRTMNLNPNGVCEYEGVYYTYDNENLVIVDVSPELLKSGSLSINSAYDTLIVSDNIKKYVKNIDLKHIKNIVGDFNCSHSILESVKGEYIESLSNYTFSGCKKLNSVYFPNLRVIGDCTFEYCKALKSLDCPKLSYMGCQSFSYTGLKELNLGDVEFNSLYSINENKLKKLIFKSVKNMQPECMYEYDLKYLDLGYFYDNACYYDFNPSLDGKTVNMNEVLETTNIVKCLIKNNLLAGEIPFNHIGPYIIPKNNDGLHFLSMDFASLKELHFKLPKAYKDLHLESYYIKMFEKGLSGNEKPYKVILDN